MSYQLIHGSAHQIPIPDASVQCVVTSPPYYSLRSYDGDQAVEWPTVEYAPMPGLPALRIQGCEPGCNHVWAGYQIPPKHSDNGIDGSTLGGGKSTQAQAQRQPTQGAYCQLCGGWRGPLGLEPTIEAYIAHLILCLREWRRVLRDDGICWVNLGDSYAGSGGAHADHHNNAGISNSAKRNGVPHFGQMGSPEKYKASRGLKPKDLMMIPARFALAAQADGWWVRSDVIWAKTAPMPESVTDRPTRAHEYIFLLAKSEKYFYDAEGVREKGSENTVKGPKPFGNKIRLNGNGTGNMADGALYECASSRNLRSVWTIGPQAFAAAHFACFPERIPELCISAGTSAYGCCPECGAPWQRRIERIKGTPESFNGSTFTNGKTVAAREPLAAVGTGERTIAAVTTGWQPTCSCVRDDVAPCVVLDPFSGSGTTGKVAARLGRSYIGVDLSEKYLTEITAQRMGDGVQMELAL